jgi:hypothetical protein
VSVGKLTVTRCKGGRMGSMRVAVYVWSDTAGTRYDAYLTGDDLQQYLDEREATLAAALRTSLRGRGLAARRRPPPDGRSALGDLRAVVEPGPARQEVSRGPLMAGRGPVDVVRRRLLLRRRRPHLRPPRRCRGVPRRAPGRRTAAQTMQVFSGMAILRDLRAWGAK